MAKKAKSTTKRTHQPAAVPAPKVRANQETVPVSKQTVGGVTGAILGAAVAGPVGAIAGGLTGALVGDASAKGKKPIKRAVDAIRSEINEAHLGDKVKSVTEKVTTKIKSLRKGKKKSAPAKKQAAPAAAAAKKSKAKPVKKMAKVAMKKAAAPKKKRAKKKS
jgi:histone H1/5